MEMYGKNNRFRYFVDVLLASQNGALITTLLSSFTYNEVNDFSKYISDKSHTNENVDVVDIANPYGGGKVTDMSDLIGRIEDGLTANCDINQYKINEQISDIEAKYAKLQLIKLGIPNKHVEKYLVDAVGILALTKCEDVVLHAIELYKIFFGNKLISNKLNSFDTLNDVDVKNISLSDVVKDRKFKRVEKMLLDNPNIFPS